MMFCEGTVENVIASVLYLIIYQWWFQNYWIFLSASCANCIYSRVQLIRLFGITSTSLTNGLPSCTETKQNEVKLTRKEMESERNILKGNETKKLQN